MTQATQSVYSFSVKQGRKREKELVEHIKADCEKTGKSFSHVVLTALTLLPDYNIVETEGGRKLDD